jgi:hypothetical protein
MGAYSFSLLGEARFPKLQMVSRFFVAKATQVALFAASLFSASAAMAAYPVSSGPTYPPDMFNYQYCEVLLDVPTSASGFPVFNTTGYGDCPNYSTLTGQAVIDSYNATYYPGNPYGLPSGATGFILDWPRNWIYDQAVESVPPGTSTYLVLDVPSSSPGVPETTFGFVGFNSDISGLAYIPSNVVRNATWTYYAGNQIFQLLDPSGNLYVMQSYARFIDPGLTYENLQDVDYMTSVMGLPTGWSYGSAQLAQQFDNNSEGNAILIQDALGNSYMMVDPTLSALPVTTPYSSVPGPMPIFGVGMAFGFSRRLRARIKSASV